MPVPLTRSLLVALSVSVLAVAGCSGHREAVCNAALARPSVLVDVNAFAGAHPDAAGELCPWRSGPTPARPWCMPFRLAKGDVTSPSPRPDDRPGTFRVYMTPGDDRLTVTIAGASDEGGTVALTGHRPKGPCGGWLYDPLRLTAAGAPVVARG